MTHEPLEPDVLDEAMVLSLGETCRLCAVHAEMIIDMVQEGLVEPVGSDPRHWRFPGTAVTRIQTALRLQRDLGVNLAGTALALELLDELNELRAAVRVLEHQRASPDMASSIRGI